MAVSEQFLCTCFCLGTYAAHMASIPFWFCFTLRELARQHSGKVVPTRYEFWAARCFLVAIIADAIRGADGLYDMVDDGSFVSVWGKVTVGARFAAWWVRDMCGFLMLLHLHEFILGWTSAVSGLPTPRYLIMSLRGTFVLALVGLGACFYAILLTNQQLWQAFTMLAVLPYNAVCAFMCARFLRFTMPVLQLRIPESENPAPQPFLNAMKKATAMTGIAHVLMLSAFPALIRQKFAWADARLVTHLPLGTWLGDVYLPTIFDLPFSAPNLRPNPALELVELAMGWFSLNMFWPTRGFMDYKAESAFVTCGEIGLGLSALQRKIPQISHVKGD